MMIRLRRRWFTEHSTIGEISVDGSLFHCYTLEDRDRPGEPKVYGATCIPAGTYPVLVNYSNRFGRLMSEIADVPGFDGIRIHKGNTDADTTGCVLVGRVRRIDWIGDCSDVYEQLWQMILAAHRSGEGIEISITDEPTSEE